MLSSRSFIAPARGTYSTAFIGLDAHKDSITAASLIRKGPDCMVITPSLIPKKPGERVKTDRRDARNLLSPRADTLTAHMPTADQEQFRDVVRAWQHATDGGFSRRSAFGPACLQPTCPRDPPKPAVLAWLPRGAGSGSDPPGRGPWTGWRCWIDGAVPVTGCLSQPDRAYRYSRPPSAVPPPGFGRSSCSSSPSSSVGSPVRSSGA